MIVSQTEIDMIRTRHGKPARRMMRLPVTYDAEAIKRPCPMRMGYSYKLQTRDLSETQWVLVNATPYARRAGGMTLDEARHEGYRTLDERMQALGDLGEPTGGNVWVIAFQPVDAPVSALDAPVFLSKVGDYTTLAGRQAVPGDPEACVIPGEGERARVMALAERQGPQLGAINRATREVESLRDSLMSMKARNRAKLIAKELAKLQAELPVGEVVRSGATSELPAERRAV
jgi:hypothetical protein